MRKPRRLSADELAPYQWQPTGRTASVRWGDGPPVAASEEGRGAREEGRGGDGSREPPSSASSHPSSLAPLPSSDAAIDWGQLFGNARPVEVEVGFGKGLFLVQSATANPNTNYFGVEIVRKYQLMATTRVAIRGLANVRTCCADAARVFRDHVSGDSVSAVHVYFPDPWWKARHKKRTLMVPEFAAEISRILLPGGHFHFATDVPEYAEMAREVVATVPTLQPVEVEPEAPPAHDMDYLTNFERRFRKQGKPIHRSRYVKVPTP